jgi:hypothetical protein
VAETVAETRSRKQRPQALDGTFEAIREDAPDPIGRLLLDRRTLERLVGLGQGCRAGVLGIAQVPDDAATDNGGEIHPLGETVTMLLIGQEICWERQPTPGQHGH